MELTKEERRTKYLLEHPRELKKELRAIDKNREYIDIKLAKKALREKQLWEAMDAIQRLRASRRAESLKERAARMERIMELRLSGKTYEEIGEIESVSRERIRQILNEIDPSLTGYKPRVPLPPKEVECSQCGTKLVVPGNDDRKHHFCNDVCKAMFWPKDPYQKIQRAREYQRKRYADPVIREKHRQAMHAYHKRLKEKMSPEEKKAWNRKQYEYRKKWFKKKFASDPAFREKVRAKGREASRKKQAKIKAAREAALEVARQKLRDLGYEPKA